MYYKNIYFHNVNQMKKTESGEYLLSRFPENILNENLENDYKTSGVELRFKMLSDLVTLTFNCFGEPKGAILIYVGSFYAKTITPIKSGIFTIEINKEIILNEFLQNEQKYYTPFSSNVIRVILPSTEISFVNVEGEVEMPEDVEMPKTKLLFFGGSVLGSSNENLTTQLPFILANNLDADYYDLSTNLATLNLVETAKFLTTLNYAVAVIEGADDNVLASNIKQYVKNYKLFVKILNKNKKVKNLFVDTFSLVTISKSNEALKKVKEISKVAKPFKEINVTKNISFKDLGVTGCYYNPSAYIELINALYFELDKVVPVYTSKDKKAVKLSKAYQKMNDTDEPTITPIILTKKELNAKLKHEKDMLEIAKANEKHKAKLEKQQQKLLSKQKGVAETDTPNTNNDVI